MMTMIIKRFDVWIADLEPANQSEPGKIRPVVIIQSDFINYLGYSSYVVCPLSSQKRVTKGSLRVFIKASSKNGLTKDSYILSDQIRTIDISRLTEKIGEIDAETSSKLVEGVKIILDL